MKDLLCKGGEKTISVRRPNINPGCFSLYRIGHPDASFALFDSIEPLIESANALGNIGLVLRNDRTSSGLVW